MNAGDRLGHVSAPAPALPLPSAAGVPTLSHRLAIRPDTRPWHILVRASRRVLQLPTPAVTNQGMFPLFLRVDTYQRTTCNLMTIGAGHVG
jgi:hypothetical protein